MADGAAKIVCELHERGEIHGVIGLGGTQGTTLCTKAMRALPYGFPKIMVSTMASGNVAALGGHQGHHHDVLRGRHHGLEPADAEDSGQRRRRGLRRGHTRT